ncbi:DUF4817 domain-containing protein [Trichonephila clavipes]|nr:DUF4817 domain-containing protein [Trichonephila clavipes]
MLPFCPNDFDDNNITKIAARAEESRQLARVHTLRAQDKDRRRYDSKHQMVSYAPGDLVLRRLSAVTYAVQDFDPASRKRKLREVVHVLRMKPYHDPAEQIETEDIPPKESYKGPITRSRIKTLEQNDSGRCLLFRGEQCRTHKSRYQVPIAELAERWTELPQVSVNGDRYRAMITNFFIPELNNHDVQEPWFKQDGATCHTARATIDLLKDTFGDRLISRFGPVNWPPRSCDLTPLDYFLWSYVKSLVYADKPQTPDHLEDNIRRVIADIRPQMLEKVIEN